MYGVVIELAWAHVKWWVEEVSLIQMPVMHVSLAGLPGFGPWKRYFIISLLLRMHPAYASYSWASPFTKEHLDENGRPYLKLIFAMHYSSPLAISTFVLITWKRKKKKIFHRTILYPSWRCPKYKGMPRDSNSIRQPITKKAWTKILINLCMFNCSA